MINKKRLLIILTISIFIFLVIFLGFYLYKKNQEKIIYSSEELKILKKEFTKFSNYKLIEYYNISKKSDLTACKERRDTDDCVISVAFIKNNSDYCHLLLTDEENEFKCLNQFLKRNSNNELFRCKTLEGDKYFNCLLEVYSFYDNKDKCLTLIDDYSIATCNQMFYYQEIYEKYDRNLCQSLVDEKIKAYCLKNILPKNDNINPVSTLTEKIKEEAIIDTDKDGLSDSDEIATYKTYPNNPDTDGDGYSDGEEVKNGFNPLGQGKLIQ